MGFISNTRPRIIIKSLTRFPAKVYAENGVGVHSSNGAYTFGLDYPNLIDSRGIEDANKATIAVYRYDLQRYEEVRLSLLGGGFGGGGLGRIETERWVFDGVATQFEIWVDGDLFEPQQAASVLVSIEGVMQEALVDFNVNGSIIIFTKAPPVDATTWAVVSGGFGGSVGGSGGTGTDYVLPPPTNTTLGGVYSDTAPAGFVQVGIDPVGRAIFRQLDGLHIPAPTLSTLGGVYQEQAPANFVQVGVDSAGRAIYQALSSVLPLPKLTTLGGVYESHAPAGTVQVGIGPDGVGVYQTLAQAGVTLPNPTGTTLGGVYSEVAPPNYASIGINSFGHNVFEHISKLLLPPEPTKLGGVYSSTAPAGQVQIGIGTDGKAIFKALTVTDLPTHPLPAPTATALGGVYAETAPSNWVQIGTDTTGHAIFRQLTSADLPLPYPLPNAIGGVFASNAPAHQFMVGIGQDGFPKYRVIDPTDLVLPAPKFTALGGVYAEQAPANHVMVGIDDSGHGIYLDISGLGGTGGGTTVAMSGEYYYTATQGQDVFGDADQFGKLPTGWASASNILVVFLNGVRLVKQENWIILDDTHIQLSRGVTAGSQVTVEVYGIGTGTGGSGSGVNSFLRCVYITSTEGQTAYSGVDKYGHTLVGMTGAGAVVSVHVNGILLEDDQWRKSSDGTLTLVRAPAVGSSVTVDVFTVDISGGGTVTVPEHNHDAGVFG
jgi:hypothetical protein